MRGAVNEQELQQIEAMYRIALALRRDADPLLWGQYDAIAGRISALLAAVGQLPPEETES